MGRLYSTDYRCEVCAHYWEAIVDFDERDVLVACPECGEPTKRLFPGPRVLNKSVHDGSDRFHDLKTEAKLRCIEANTWDKNEKKRIQAERYKLTRVKK